MLHCASLLRVILCVFEAPAQKMAAFYAPAQPSIINSVIIYMSNSSDLLGKITINASAALNVTGT